jgi:hypothetical protein
MSTKHTPGPWQWVDGQTDEVWTGGALYSGSLRTVEEFGKSETVERDGQHYTTFALPKFIVDCECIGGDDEAEANARLIAAAPELLAVCKALMRYQELIDSDTTTGLLEAYAEAFEGAEAAVAKAIGGNLDT